MRIAIAARHRPFSHQPGTTALLPGTSWALQAFPALLRLYPLDGWEAPIEIPLPFTGPVREFTLQQDLEKGCLQVWGTAKEGRFCFTLKAEEKKVFFEGREIALTGPFREAPDRLERISFGSHKAQNGDALLNRASPSEILPLLFSLSQWTPEVQKSPRTAMFDLLDGLDEPFLRAAFFGILCPRLTDDQHQGLLPPQEKIPANASPIALIGEAGAKIRESLLVQRGNQILLPAPVHHPAGRMVGAKLPGIGLLDFEWRQKRLRRAVLHAEEAAVFSFELPKAIRTFRLRTKKDGKGQRFDAAKEWQVEKGTVYFLDRFEK